MLPWIPSVVALTLPLAPLRRFSKAVTLRLRWGLFLLSPFAMLAALAKVKSGRSSPESSILKDKKTSSYNTQNIIQPVAYKQPIMERHPVAHTAHLGRLLLRLESAEGSCGSSVAALSWTTGDLTGSESHDTGYKDTFKKKNKHLHHDTRAERKSGPRTCEQDVPEHVPRCVCLIKKHWGWGGSLHLPGPGRGSPPGSGGQGLPGYTLKRSRIN